MFFKIPFQSHTSMQRLVYTVHFGSQGKVQTEQDTRKFRSVCKFNSPASAMPQGFLQIARSRCVAQGTELRRERLSRSFRLWTVLLPLLPRCWGSWRGQVHRATPTRPLFYQATCPRYLSSLASAWMTLKPKLQVSHTSDVYSGYSVDDVCSKEVTHWLCSRKVHDALVCLPSSAHAMLRLRHDCPCTVCMRSMSHAKLTYDYAGQMLLRAYCKM